MLPDDGVPTRLVEILEPVMRRAGIDAGVESGRVWSAWEQIVGRDIADHAEPTSLRKGVLRVRTDSPVWATELTYLSEEIVSRVNETLGGDVVAAVKVWTAPGRVHRHRKDVQESKVPPPEAVRDDDPMAALNRARTAWTRFRGGRDDGRGARSEGR
jgi:predicted nucleic acid-binding Zn ribbon protein